VKNGLKMTAPDLNSEAMAVRVPVSMGVAELQDFLKSKGYTLGEFHPPVSGGKSFAISDWLKEPLIPACHYDCAFLPERIISIEGSSLSGRVLKTNSAPRSATGPDLNFLISASHGEAAVVEAVKLRIKKAPGVPVCSSYEMGNLGVTVKALASLAHERAFFESIRMEMFDAQGWSTVISLTHDVETELGRARMAFCDKLITSAGGSKTGEKVLGELPAEFLPGEIFEIYTAYDDYRGIAEAAGCMRRSGARRGWLYRYGREGLSVRFSLKDLKVPAEEAIAEARSAGMLFGACEVKTGGPLGTNGKCEVVEKIYKRVINSLESVKD